MMIMMMMMMMIIIIIIIMCNNIVTLSLAICWLTRRLSLYFIFAQVLKMALYGPKHVAVVAFSKLMIVVWRLFIGIFNSSNRPFLKNYIPTTIYGPIHHFKIITFLTRPSNYLRFANFKRLSLELWKASSEVIYCPASVADWGARHVVMKCSELARITPLSKIVKMVSTAIIA